LEKFFDELGKIPEADINNLDRVKHVMAEFGMELLGPPLFGMWRQQRKRFSAPGSRHSRLDSSCARKAKGYPSRFAERTARLSRLPVI
jgi:hypothetical protein